MKIQHQLLLDTAKKLGIEITDVSYTMKVDAAILEANGKRELIVRGTPTSLINLRSQYFCDNKQLTKVTYKALNIPSPSSMVFQEIDDAQIPVFLKKENSYVCKPIDGTNGVGVGMNIKSIKNLKTYWKRNKSHGTTFMLEEQIEGNDLRIQVVGGQVVAACTRIPAFVVGNGKHRLAELITKLKRRTQANNPANDFVIDEVTEKLLVTQGLDLEDIPKLGRTVELKKVANMAQGAIAMDISDELHPAFQTWISELSHYLGATYFGIDIIAKDHRQPPENGAWVLEINARPEWLHHTFSEGRRHDLAGLVLKTLFKVV